MFDRARISTIVSFGVMWAAACGWLAVVAAPTPAWGQCEPEELAQLIASDAAATDKFGNSIAVSGDTAVVGAFVADIAEMDGAGAAYVFVRSGPPGGELWIQQAKLTASDGAPGDIFGISVAVSGDTVVVGAYGAEIADMGFAGAAYVFVRSGPPGGEVWTEQAKLIAFDPGVGEEFGVSVAASGDTAVVGAHYDGGNAAGAAYVFTRSGPTGGETWTQQAKLTASDGGLFDYLGTSVAVSGDTVVAGAYQTDDACDGYLKCDSGSAYVFVRSGDLWTEQAKLTASDAAPGDSLGISVAVLDDTAVLGAPSNDHGVGYDAGSAYVFVRSGSVWTEQAKLTASDAAGSDTFGNSVAVMGDTAVVGAYLDDHAGGEDAGSAYVFRRSGAPGSEVWTEQARLFASDAAGADAFGYSVAVTGDTAVVGAHWDDHAAGEDAGSAFIFECTVPACPVPITASDAAADNEFGISVAISGDTAVVGARLDDNASGDAAGSAYVYVRSGPPGSEVWTEQAKLIGTNINGGHAGSQSGISVAISGDTAIVGSWLWPSMQAIGAAYVFVRSGAPGNEVWTQQAFLTNTGFFGAAQYFGYSVALEGDTALVGGLQQPGLNVAGLAIFFARTGPPGGEIWTPYAAHPSDGMLGDQFGNSVALSAAEDMAVIGAHVADNAGGVDAGSAYVFTRTGTTQNHWVQSAMLTASDGAADDRFGIEVAINEAGDTIVVGAYQDDDAGGESGSAYIFVRSGSPGSEVWTEQAKLTASDAAAGDRFGGSLALSGNTVVIGAYADDNSGGSDAGSAYVFTRSGPPGSEVWTERLQLTPCDGGTEDWFGVAVALSGDTPVIGARQDDNTGGANAGSAYVFDLSVDSMPGDCNLDDQVNLEDYAGFSACVSGPMSPSGDGCECFDLDGDGDVDLLDFGAFADAFTG